MRMRHHRSFGFASAMAVAGSIMFLVFGFWLAALFITGVIVWGTFCLTVAIVRGLTQAKRRHCALPEGITRVQ